MKHTVSISAMISAAGATLQTQCHEASYNSGWWLGPVGLDVREMIRHPDSDWDRYLAGAVVAQKIALIHSEASEGLEGARKDLMDDKLPHRKMLEVELADAVIRIFDLAGALDYDLGGAIAEKLAYNAQRADHKPENRSLDGGKKF
jgi:NTP pyrophosphatase (non-canonical NTP hydrolase)